MTLSRNIAMYWQIVRCYLTILGLVKYVAFMALALVVTDIVLNFYFIDRHIVFYLAISLFCFVLMLSAGMVFRILVDNSHFFLVSGYHWRCGLVLFLIIFLSAAWLSFVWQTTFGLRSDISTQEWFEYFKMFFIGISIYTYLLDAIQRQKPWAWWLFIAVLLIFAGSLSNSVFAEVSDTWTESISPVLLIATFSGWYIALRHLAHGKGFQSNKPIEFRGLLGLLDTEKRWPQNYLNSLNLLDKMRLYFNMPLGLNARIAYSLGIGLLSPLAGVGALIWLNTIPALEAAEKTATPWPERTRIFIVAAIFISHITLMASAQMSVYRSRWLWLRSPGDKKQQWKTLESCHLRHAQFYWLSAGIIVVALLYLPISFWYAYFFAVIVVPSLYAGIYLGLALKVKPWKISERILAAVIGILMVFIWVSAFYLNNSTGGWLLTLFLSASLTLISIGLRKRAQRGFEQIDWRTIPGFLERYMESAQAGKYPL